MYNLEKLDAVFVPVGGGGMISGIAAYIKNVSPKTKVVGCSPFNNACIGRSMLKGYIIPEGQFEVNGGGTLSEGTAGGVQEGSITFDICRKYVDDWVEVSETEIESAVVGFLNNHHKVIEGAAGVSIASYLKVR